MRVEDVVIEVDGTYSGGPDLGYSAVQVLAKDADVVLKDIAVRYDMTGSTAADIHFAGVVAASVTDAPKSLSIDGFRMLPSTVVGHSGVLGVQLWDAIAKGVLLRGCDFSGFDSSAVPVGTNISGTLSRGSIRSKDCIYTVPPAPAAITLPVVHTIDENTLANPSIVRTTAAHGLRTGDSVFIAGSNSTPVIDGWRVVTVIDTTHFSVPVNVGTAGTAGTVIAAYCNRDFYDEDVVVRAGTVTKIEISTDGGTTFTETGLTAGIFRLRDDDRIYVTNSSAPTTTKVPRP
jgi:hypothetical protein